MLRRIPRDPVLPFGIKWFGRRAPDVFPFSHKQVHFYGFARTALLEGLRLFGIQDGDEVLIPDYICNVILAPLHALKIKAVFYSLDAELRPNWDQLKRSLTPKTKALMLVNYFGFPNDLETAQKFCREHGIYFIEDNAHGFLSARRKEPLGSFGDFSIFSFRKTFPVPNGACLLINREPKSKFAHKTAALKQKNESKNLLKKYIFSLSYLTGISIDSRRSNPTELLTMTEKDKQEEYEMDDFLIEMAGIGHRMLRGFDYEQHRQIRRLMYKNWSVCFREKQNHFGRALFSNLEEGVVPQVFPVISEQRDELIKQMWQSGIECYPWPFLPKGSSETHFSKRIVCLPVFPFFNINSFIKSQDNK